MIRCVTVMNVLKSYQNAAFSGVQKESIYHESPAHQRQPPREGLHLYRTELIAGELNAAGIETEILNVGTKPVGGCIGCGGCAAGKGCVFGGVVNEAIEKAKTADAFVFGTPVHYASASGNMTSFMDRLAYAGGRYLAYKPAAICCWPMVHGSNPKQVLQDAEGCAVMQELGRNMAWLLRCIEAGKAAGIQHPENPRRPMTNFIR